MYPFLYKSRKFLEAEEGEGLPHGEFDGVDDPFVDGAYKSEEEDADEAEAKSYLCYTSALECANLWLFIRNPHCLDNTEIVVERDDCVDEGNEHEHIKCH